MQTQGFESNGFLSELQSAVDTYRSKGFVSMHSHETRSPAKSFLLDLFGCLEALAADLKVGISRPQPDANASLKAIATEVQKHIASCATQNRRLISVLYDEAKNLPTLFNLLTNPTILQSIGVLLETTSPRIGKESVGLRLDISGEQKYDTLAHQEFPF